MRRSTRVNRAVQLAVEGVDSFRGPYHEEVSTITVNAHGCMYESNHEVLNNAFVVLQLNGKDAKPVSARGHVKWTQRPVQTGGLHLTAIELDAPGNIWGIDSPPGDWLPFCGPLESRTRAQTEGGSGSPARGDFRREGGARQRSIRLAAIFRRAAPGPVNRRFSATDGSDALRRGGSCCSG